MTFSYLSICSGLGGARLAFSPLGARCVGEAEIEPFPSAILAYRYGANMPGDPLSRNSAPNFGDFTKIDPEELEEQVDVLVGGTPCQSFSLAGLRGGLNDDRGNLTLEFLRLADRINPEAIVWENVPGVISDNTDALTTFLDGLEELGYVIDIDILDAQFFGVPQRRRRVFVCAQRSDAILKQRTLTSALTIAQCLVECLHLTLGVLVTRSVTGFAFSGFRNLECAHSLRRRMKLFGLDSVTTVSMLLGNLGVLQLLSERGPSASVSGSGSENSKSSEDTESRKSNEATERWREECLSTGMLWKSILEENLQTMRSCITSTATSATTESKIFICAQMALGISRLITQSMDSSPTFWTAASSSSTALREFISYARQASSDLFGDMGRVSAWHDFIEQAEHTDQSLSNFGVECFGEVLPVSQSLRGNSPPRREAGEGIAPTIAARARGGGGLGTDFDCDGGVIPEITDSRFSMPSMRRDECGDMVSDLRVVRPRAFGGNNRSGPIDVATAVNAHGGPCGRMDFETETFIAHTLLAKANDSHAADLDTYIAHALRGEGFDSSDDGTGRGTPIVPICFDETQITSQANRSNPQPGDPSHTLAKGARAPAIAFRTSGNCGAWETGDKIDALTTGSDPNSHVVAFDLRGRDGGAQFEGPHDTANIRAASGGSSRSYVAERWAVRRLTPEECEKLQGIPVGHTRIPWRGKTADQCPDGPRYKAIGNGWADPVMSWIGRRLAASLDQAKARP